MTMPAQRPGSSKQDYATPRDFVEAVEIIIGSRFVVDLAASSENAVCPIFIDAAQNSLVQPWHEIAGWVWLNPPFARIAPWVEKCALEAAQGSRIVALLPAAVSTNWFRKYVAGKAMVLFVRPRLSFVGAKDPYPKDLMVCIYNSPIAGYGTWDWKTQST